MKKTVLLLAILLLLGAVACSGVPEYITLETDKSVYEFDGGEILYRLVYTGEDEITCSSYAYLERATENGWERVASAKPDPVAWCGTLYVLKPGETHYSLPFSDHNGTLCEGTYRISFDYSLKPESGYHSAHSEEFELAGEFPLTERSVPPADIRLVFESETFSKGTPLLEYRIVNNSEHEMSAAHTIILMLMKDGRWSCFLYDTGEPDGVMSAEKEFNRIIDAQKLPDIFSDYSKIRIIEKVTIPMQNEFYLFYEADIE